MGTNIQNKEELPHTSAHSLKNKLKNEVSKVAILFKKKRNNNMSIRIHFR